MVAQPETPTGCGEEGNIARLSHDARSGGQQREGIKRNSQHITHVWQPLSLAMRFRLRYFSTLKSFLCARFHVMHSPAYSATDCQMQGASELSTSDRRLDIFLEQQTQPWNASKLLEASIIVNVVLPDGVGVPTSFAFDARSPAPTPAHILSIFPDSMKCIPSLSNSAALGGFTPIAAAVNGRVVGLGDTERSHNISICGLLL